MKKTTQVESLFKSYPSEQRWINLQETKKQLSQKSSTKANQENIDTIISLMTTCKVGFNLSEAKVKKTIKFIKEKTGKERVKYGTLPEGKETSNILFGDLILICVEQDDVLIFRERNKS